MYARVSFILLLLVLVLSSCQEKKADFFERDAREFTQTHCPQMMDDVTRVDSIVFVKKEDRMGDLLLYYSLFMEDASSKILMDNLGEFFRKRCIIDCLFGTFPSPPCDSAVAANQGMFHISFLGKDCTGSANSIHFEY